MDQSESNQCTDPMNERSDETFVGGGIFAMALICVLPKCHHLRVYGPDIPMTAGRKDTSPDCNVDHCPVGVVAGLLGSGDVLALAPLTTKSSLYPATPCVMVLEHLL